jgi:hypothetical protein
LARSFGNAGDPELSSGRRCKVRGTSPEQALNEDKRDMREPKSINLVARRRGVFEVV